MRKTVVFVDIDTQEDFIAAEGRLSVPGAEALLPTFAALTRYAGAHGIPILSSADAHSPDDPEFELFPPHCIVGSHGARKVVGTTLDAAATVAPDGTGLPDYDAPQVILEKTTFDVFSNPAADVLLARLRPDHVFVYGVATDYCVLQAVSGLRERGFDVIVGADAIAGVTADGARRAVDAMRASGAQFTTTSEVLGGAVGMDS